MPDVPKGEPNVVEVRIRVIALGDGCIVEVATDETVHFRSAPMTCGEAFDLAGLWAETLGGELEHDHGGSVH